MKPTKVRDRLDKRQKKYLKDKFGIKAYKDLCPTILKNLKEAMKDLTDSRQKGKKIYKIWDIVLCVVISVLCGKKDWEEIHDFVEEKYDFFRSFLKMSGGIPSAKTYKRVMAIIDYKELEKILNTFLGMITKDIIHGIDILSFDGRVSNGSKRKETLKQEKVSPLNMLNVYSTQKQMCICSQIIDKKTNEIPNIIEVIKQINIKGGITVWDALNTQKENVAFVIEKGADYVAPIKANHPTFYQELIDYFNEKEEEYIKAGKSNSAYKKIHEYKNGKAITYEYFQTTDVYWFEDIKEWESLHSIGMVKKTIEGKEETVIERRYYISSLFINIDLFSDAIRKEWHVENKLHWHLDVTFRQDKNRTIDKNALANLEIVNKFCLAILQRVKKYYNKSLKRIMSILSANVEENFLELIALLILSDGKIED